MSLWINGRFGGAGSRDTGTVVLEEVCDGHVRGEHDGADKA